MDLKKMLELKRKMTPTEGFNVVGVDDFESDGLGLYLVGHYKTEDEAKQSKARHEKTTEDATYIYSAK